MEAKYYATGHALKEGIWIKLFLEITGLHIPKPFPILSDNQASLSLMKTGIISSRSKHIDVKHHFIRSHIADGSFSATWVPMGDMSVDIFTKPLNTTLFSRHWMFLGLENLDG